METESTTHRVLQIRRDTPSKRAIEIAEEMGVTRERVRQILAKAYTETGAFCYRPNLLICGICGHHIDSRYNSGRKYKGKPLGVCLLCKRESAFVKCNCKHCDKDFLRRKSTIARNVKKGIVNTFCNRKCAQRYIHRSTKDAPSWK